MKIHALAIIAAFAMPVLASADTPPANEPPMNPPTDKNPPADKANPPSDTKAGDTNKPKTGDKSAKLSDGDVKIIAHLHHVNQMEMNLAKLAQKTGTARIKSFTDTLDSDHQSADKDLTAFAKSHKLATIPAEKPETDADRQDDKDMTTAMAHLKTLKGADFDKQFLDIMVSGHDKELTKIDTSISSASDQDLQSMLRTVKPVLQRHADQARDLQKSPQASIDPSKPIDHLPSAH